MSLTPALVLAALVGTFHTAVFLFASGRIGFQTILVLAAAILGAWAGDAVAGMLGVDPFRVGDFRLLTASLAAWGGIGFVEALLVLGPASQAARARTSRS